MIRQSLHTDYRSAGLRMPSMVIETGIGPMGRELLVALSARAPSTTAQQLWWSRLQSTRPGPISPTVSVLVEAVQWLAGYGI